MNRLIYDACAYSTSLGESTAPVEYMLDLSAHEHCDKCRVDIGIVGGTNVSHVNGTLVDIENDLKGINRPSTKCPGFNFLPTADGSIQGKEYIKPVCHPRIDMSSQNHLRVYAPLLEIIDRKDYDNLSAKHRMLLPYVVIQMSCGDSLVRGIINNRKKITGNEMIETSLKKFIESNMKWVSNKANIHVSKDGRKRIDDYKGKEYQNVIVANALLMLLLNALVTGNDEIVAFERFEAIMHA
eukprot:gene29990-18063_t